MDMCPLFGVYKKKLGFSLVEQIIVLTIVSLLSLMAVISFSDITVKQKRISGMEFLYGDLVRIRNYAMSGYSKDSEKLPVAYGINLSGKSSYEIFSIYDMTRLDDVDFIESRSLSDSLSFDPSEMKIYSIIPDGAFCISFRGSNNLECSGNTDIYIGANDSAYDEKSHMRIDHTTGTLTVTY